MIILAQIHEHVLYNEIQAMHHTPEDFSEGDLGERIENFPYYNLISQFDLTLLFQAEFSLDLDLVEEYAALILENGIENMPPIVIDDNFSIIDGIHRLNAMILCGILKADLYMGTRMAL